MAVAFGLIGLIGFFVPPIVFFRMTATERPSVFGGLVAGIVIWIVVWIMIGGTLIQRLLGG